VNVAIEHVMGEAQVAQTKDIRNIAMTATHGDEKIASLIVEAMKRVGKDGVITTEYAVGGETALYISEGMQFDRGYLSPYFVTDSDRGECVLEDCYILISEERIASMRQVIPVLEQVAREGKPLLVIAGDVEGEALSTMVVNKLRGSLACAAVRAPGSGDNRKALLEDIAVFSGGRAFTEDLGASVVQARPIDLGKARKVVITKDTISLIEGAGAPEEISARAKMIRVMAESADTGSAEKLRERLARLVGGIARIQAGGVTDEDALDQAYKIQSAMFASNAITAGWVSGGGLALLRAKKAVDRLTCQEEGENAGTRSVAYALMQPISRLVENSGRSPTQLVHQIQEQAALVNGFNAKSGKVENLDEAGVIEPARLLVQTLRIAFSHTREILLTGAWDVTP
jgi:chaperonin GroEL